MSEACVPRLGTRGPRESFVARAEKLADEAKIYDADSGGYVVHPEIEVKLSRIHDELKQYDNDIMRLDRELKTLNEASWRNIVAGSKLLQPFKAEVKRYTSRMQRKRPERSPERAERSPQRREDRRLRIGMTIAEAWYVIYFLVVVLLALLTFLGTLLLPPA